MNSGIFVVMLILFLGVTLALGWYGYKRTKGSDSFLIGNKSMNSTILALSYGATFLSASAIVGFGGQAAKYGLSMVWLVFLNLFVGVIVAFIVFGKPTRKLGKELKAFTFSDLLGKRFKSNFIRIFAAIVILVGMPVYCAAVLLGGVNFIDSTLHIDRNLILIIIAVITGIYVVYGGLIAVMYNDALQAGVMFVGMIIVGIVTFSVIGGSGTDLNSLWEAAQSSPSAQHLAEQGMTGWTSFPTFGSEAWWTLVSTFMLGVGIGALAQPQLVVRFMAAKDSKSMNRSLVVGSIFIFVIVGIAYTMGAFTNVFFWDNHHQIAIDYVNNVDMIIPTYVNELFAQFGTLGDVFVALFTLAILTASISTMSALLHTMGAAGSYDILSKIKEKMGQLGKGEDYHSLRTNRIVTAVMLVVVVIVAFFMPSNIIAKATSIFMGLTAATLLPAYAYAVFGKGTLSTKATIASIVLGAVVWVFWAFFVNAGIANVIQTPLLFTGIINFVDPLVIALPVAVVTLLIGIYVDRGYSVPTTE